MMGGRTILTQRRRAAGLALVVLCVFLPLRNTFAYAVLTHEAIIDGEWNTLIKPLLLKRFPNATPAQLHEAYAYAYGGSVIQDMGYYPFGNSFFSRLTHYVRSGDFVEALFDESHDINDYAFALGALSHYVADIHGHSLAVNRCVPLLYPHLHKEYGNWITWEDSPWARMLTEFGFDTLEVVARHNAPQAYRDWIGFKVPKPLLERAFKSTYGLDLSKQILDVDLALASYRVFANKIIPEMTEVAWVLRQSELEKLARSQQHQRLYHLSRLSYAAWRKRYTRPGIGDHIEAFFFLLIPKVGPLNAFQFHAPTPETEKLFADSLRATVADYRLEIAKPRAVRFDPPDMDLDTGSPTRPGEYKYCDKTYAQLLQKLAKNHFAGVSPALRANLDGFYSDTADNTVRRHPRQWRRVERELAGLNSTKP